MREFRMTSITTINISQNIPRKCNKAFFWAGPASAVNRGAPQCTVVHRGSLLDFKVIGSHLVLPFLINLAQGQPFLLAVSLECDIFYPNIADSFLLYFLYKLGQFGTIVEPRIREMQCSAVHTG
jgi:hypothetical protein